MTVAMYSRQEGLIKMDLLSKMRASVIGAGAVGSYASLALAKMGIGELDIFDDDSVNSHNLPNQFFKHDTLTQYKVHALADQLEEIVDKDCVVHPQVAMYIDQPLLPIVIVAVDSMKARKAIYEQFKAQKSAMVLIEARMGGQLGCVYTLKKAKGILSAEDDKWYQQMLYTDEEADSTPCTEKAIIYNVQMVSALICRAVRAVVMQEETYPREVIFDMNHMQLFTQE